MKTIPLSMLVVVLSAAVLVGGCSKKEGGSTTSSGGGIDLETPIAQLKEAAAQLDLAALEKTAQKYVDEIVAKQGELEKITKALAEIPLTEKLGEEAKGLQSDLSDLGGALGELNKRLKVYVDYIKEKGGDISKFAISK